MPAKVVPSEIVVIIDKISKKFKEEDETNRPISGTFEISVESNGDAIAAILALVDQLEPANLPPDQENYCNLQIALASARNSIERWKNAKTVSHERGVVVKGSSLTGQLNPISLIRRACRHSYDSPIPDSVAGLDFVNDKKLQKDLRTDVACVESLTNFGWWKATCVIAGSAVEALLLDVILKDKENADQAIENIEGLPKKLKKVEYESLSLWDYIMICRAMGVISEEVEKLCVVLKDYRNLIHPGRTIRLEKSAEKAEAVVSSGALLIVIKEISAYYRNRKL